MKLRPAEKLILAILCDISHHRSSRILNYHLIEKMLQYENAWDINWDHFIEEVSKFDLEKSRLVVDVLDMCLMIHNSYQQLNPKDQQEFFDFNDGKPFVFYGFCPENEPDYYALEQLYIANIEYYKPLHHEIGVGGDGLKIPRYLRMLKEYKRLLSEYPVVKRLSKDGIIELISI